ncbi:crotonase/enoyl-CoA hydratase family protein [soil metagenome]
MVDDPTIATSESKTMDYETLTLDTQDRILTLRLNRPAQLNAFTVQMANELIQAFEQASDNDSVGAIVVTGEGRAFCAGMDLSVPGNVFGLDETMQPTLADLTDRFDDPSVVTGVRDTGGRVALAIHACKKPVIAAINGAAIGIGSTMTLAMDARIASSAAKFGFVFGKIGIVPEACSSWFLPRLVGLAQALEWVYSAEIFDAQEALRGGLVRSVVEPDQLLPEAYKLAQRFVRNKSPVSIALMRQMMLRNGSTDPAQAHRIESLAMFYASVGDGKEGVASFLEKRAPAFEGRASDGMPPFYPWW